MWLKRVPTPGILEPKSVILSNSSALITWFEPEEPNGLIEDYQLQRLDSLSSDWIHVHSGVQMQTVDSELSPGEDYSYRVQVG